MKAKIILYCFFSTVVLVHCVNSDSLSGKVLFGYQGWFDTPSSGSGRGWVHWSSGTPNPDSCTFDLWPDVSEFNESALDWSTELYDINGNSMPLYASNSVDVQDVHFRWMRDYGIDGVVIQRFVSELSSPTMKAFRDSILTNALVAAEKYGVVVSLMYDISGASAEDWDDIIFEDWNYLTGNLSMTASSSYLNHNELPVLFVWGLGFNDREATAEDSLAFVNNMKNETYFIGGVPTYWRTCDGDSLPGFEDVYAAMDAIAPWLVGRFGSTDEFDHLLQNVIVDDSILTSSRGQGYAPNVWPGFSWYNLQKDNPDDDSPLNQIPRDGGNFWQHQFDGFVGGSLADGAPLFVYGAMFDEFDESTAMAKAAPNKESLPQQGQFLHLSIDGTELPSDFYLKLAGNNSKKYKSISPVESKSHHTEAAVYGNDALTRIMKGKAKDMAALQWKNKIRRTNKLSLGVD